VKHSTVDSPVIVYFVSTMWGSNLQQRRLAFNWTHREDCVTVTRAYLALRLLKSKGTLLSSLSR